MKLLHVNLLIWRHFAGFAEFAKNVFSVERGHILMKKYKNIKKCNIFVTFLSLLRKTYLQNWFQKVLFWWFSWILVTNVHFLLVSWYSGLLVGVSLNRLIPKGSQMLIIRKLGIRGGPLPFAKSQKFSAPSAPLICNRLSILCPFFVILLSIGAAGEIF